MSTAPNVSIDMGAFHTDPYPMLARLRAESPIAFIPQLQSTLLTRRDDIFVCEKNIDVFSSYQPQGLMNRLMGHNMMRKDGPAHQAERKVIFPTISPKTVQSYWRQLFFEHARRILEELRGHRPSGVHAVDLHDAFALPFSAECLKSITGLTNMRYQDMDAWSQAMIAGIANYNGDAAIEAACHLATAGIDAAIDDMLPVIEQMPDPSLLRVMLQAGMDMESVRANIKLAISGGQNEPRHVILGSVWALLTHPEARAAVTCGALTYHQVFDEYVRWISPIGMSPRRVVANHTFGGVTFVPEDRVFLMFGSANRDEVYFDGGDRFDPWRDATKSVPFGAGPHFCAGAWVSRSMIADVALPELFKALPDLAIDQSKAVRISGWAFRGLQNLPVAWSR
ncbi:MAG: cytochrome P450 [Hyphomicrobiaceae bacterium]|nr:cytochrome P450 [Hyphomicrobiaceae bacterium]